MNRKQLNIILLDLQMETLEQVKQSIAKPDPDDTTSIATQAKDKAADAILELEQSTNERTT